MSLDLPPKPPKAPEVRNLIADSVEAKKTSEIKLKRKILLQAIEELELAIKKSNSEYEYKKALTKFTVVFSGVGAGTAISGTLLNPSLAAPTVVVGVLGLAVGTVSSLIFSLQQHFDKADLNKLRIQLAILKYQIEQLEDVKPSQQKKKTPANVKLKQIVGDYYKW